MYSCTMRQLADTQLKATLMCSSNSMATCGRAVRGLVPYPWLGQPSPSSDPPGPTCRMSQLTFHWAHVAEAPGLDHVAPGQVNADQPVVGDAQDLIFPAALEPGTQVESVRGN